MAGAYKTLCSWNLFSPSIFVSMLLPTTMNLTCSLVYLDQPLPSADAEVDILDFDCGLSTSSSYASSDDDSDDEDDEDERDNVRVAPHWEAYRHLFESHGYHLDTCKDVRQFYLRYWETRNIQQSIQSCAGYNSACREDRDENELCKDEGLVSPLLYPPSPSVGLLALITRSYISSGSRHGKLTTIPFLAHIAHLRLLYSPSVCSEVNAWRTTFQS